MGQKILLDAAGNSEALENLSSQGNTYSMKSIMKLPSWKDDLRVSGKAAGKRAQDVEL